MRCEADRHSDIRRPFKAPLAKKCERGGLKIFADLQIEASDPWPVRDLTPEATLPKPMGNIRSLRGAVAAMQGKQRARLTAKLPRQLPTIVLHGDNDRVVHPSNAGGFLANLEWSRPGPLACHIASGSTGRGRDFMRRTYRTRSDQTLLEDWTVNGSGTG